MQQVGGLVGWLMCWLIGWLVGSSAGRLQHEVLVPVLVLHAQYQVATEVTVLLLTAVSARAWVFVFSSSRSYGTNLQWYQQLQYFHTLVLAVPVPYISTSSWATPLQQ